MVLHLYITGPKPLASDTRLSFISVWCVSKELSRVSCGLCVSDVARTDRSCRAPPASCMLAPTRAERPGQDTPPRRAVARGRLDALERGSARRVFCLTEGAHARLAGAPVGLRIQGQLPVLPSTPALPWADFGERLSAASREPPHSATRTNLSPRQQPR